MKYTEEELIEAATILKMNCYQTDCSECVFGIHQPNCELNLDGKPYEWDISVLKRTKKIVPLDFSLKEDRDALIGKRIYSEKLKDDRIINKIYFQTNGWYADIFFAEELLEEYVFVDTGKPVGKEVEE